MEKEKYQSSSEELDKFYSALKMLEELGREEPVGIEPFNFEKYNSTPNITDRKDEDLRLSLKRTLTDLGDFEKPKESIKIESSYFQKIKSFFIRLIYINK